MFPLLGGLISGGASLLGSMFSSDTAAKNNQQQIAAQQQMQQESESFNAGQADISRAYNTQMSNTAYQRASADMKAAGINPMVMANGGSAASTPSSPTASIGTPTVPVSQSRGAFAGIGDAVNKGLDAAVTAKTFDRMTQEIANLKAQEIKTGAETLTEQRKPELVSAETGATKARESETYQDVTAKKLDRARQEFEAMKYLDLSGISDTARKTGNIAQWGAGKISDVVAPLLSSALGTKALTSAFKDRWP